MSSETTSAGTSADVTVDVTEASDAAEQMAAATQSLRQRFPLLQTGDTPTTEPYPA